MTKLTKSLERCLAPMFSLLLASACTAGGDASPPEGGAADAGKVEHPKPDPKPAPEPVTTAKISVASVQMIQDCPDNEPEPAVADEAASQPMSAEKRAPAMPPSPGASMADVGPGDSFQQPCDQSTVQLALENSGDAAVAVEIKAVRILAKDKVVGTLATRKPKIWTNNSYEAWDQTVAPNTPTKASYKLALPNWSEVEKAIGVSSFGHMFTLELDVAIDGQVQTVSSPEFPREEPHVIVT